jgi:predicted double-glycine peptidase
VPHRLPALVLSAAAAACAGSGPGLYPVSDSATLLEVPVIRQDRLYDCGMAAVSALCAYHAVDPDPAAAAALADLAEASEGLSGGEVRDFLTSLGFEALLFRGTLDREETGALRHLEGGRPLLVMVSFDEGAQFHYCLLVGHDPELDTVHLLDPRRGLVLLPTRRFDQVWAAAERFCLLAVPPGRK